MKRIMRCLAFLLLALFISGCSGVTEQVAVEPVIEQAVVEKPAVVQAQEKVVVTKTLIKDDKYYIDLIDLTLEGFDMNIASIDVADGRRNGGEKSLIVAYDSNAQTETGVGLEMGYVLGVYLEAVNMDMDVDSLMVIVSNNDVMAMWYCSKDVTSEYMDGNIDYETLVALTFLTLELI